MTIKSITPVLTNRGWLVRVRLHDGSELFSAPARNGHNLTLAEAQATASSLSRDIARHGVAGMLDGYAPLPAGLTLARQ
jgi:hypothetical protein